MILRMGIIKAQQPLNQSVEPLYPVKIPIDPLKNLLKMKFAWT
jgi:hypothetical protein